MTMTLFESSNIGPLSVKNRFVRSATWEGMADEGGSCTPKLVELTKQLAKGEVGLIVSSHAFVSPEGQAGPWQLAVYDDRFVPGLAQMAEAAREGGSAMVLQLAHAGVQAATPLTKTEAIGPSDMADENGANGREMTLAEIERTKDAFVAAAGRAKAAGFDGVQIHGAHGYLLSQFLSSYYNKREDEFGRSVENRARIVLDILGGIKSTLGEDFPVLIKMNSEDFIDVGLSVEEMLQVAKMLEDAGIDGIELSGGTADGTSRFQPVRRGRLRTEEDEVFYREAAKRYRECIGVPLILVGGIRSCSVAAKLVEDGVTDFVSLSRPLIREPGLVARWKSGDTAKSECGSCNLCFKPILEGNGMYCVAKDRPKKRRNRQ
jgi:2,4-dienoyl-CoA reductase-like NADH-dependent reductase (Old Yellow Enzyme family)